MIHEVSGYYVISSGHAWLPGCYATSQAARYAFQFPDEALRALQESVNRGGIITMAMLKDARKSLDIDRMLLHGLVTIHNRIQQERQRHSAAQQEQI